jgi:hypothetical protein
MDFVNLIDNLIAVRPCIPTQVRLALQGSCRSGQTYRLQNIVDPIHVLGHRSAVASLNHMKVVFDFTGEACVQGSSSLLEPHGGCI